MGELIWYVNNKGCAKIVMGDSNVSARSMIRAQETLADQLMLHLVCELILYTTGRGCVTYIYSGITSMKISDYGEAKA